VTDGGRQTADRSYVGHISGVTGKPNRLLTSTYSMLRSAVYGPPSTVRRPPSAVRMIYVKIFRKLQGDTIINLPIS
jgi:hypothetical protein